MKNSRSFTLIEILVVATIIVLLSTAGIVTYSQFSKQSRDSKRKGDLEQVRAALEMYRSNDSSSLYPVAASWSALDSGNFLEGGTPKYMESLPSDPKSGYTYYYNSASGSTYTIGAYLETGSGSCAAGACGTDIDCNYCLTPYGRQ